MESLAIPFLEQLQKQEFEKFGLSLSERSQTIKRVEKKYVKDMIKKVGKKASKKEKREFKKQVKEHYKRVLAQKQITKYEDPLFMDILTHLNKTIVEGFKNIHFKSGDIDIRFDKLVESEPKPILGTLPSGNVNANVRIFPETNEYLIIFENELFVFCNLISKIIAKAMPFKGKQKVDEIQGKPVKNMARLTFGHAEEEISKSLEEKPDVYSKFQELIESYLINGSPSTTTQYYLDYPYSSIADNIRDGMEIFALAHEYSHIHMDHLHQTDTKFLKISDQDAQKILYSWEQEYQADQGGLLLTIGAMMVKRWDASLSYWGIELFLYAIDCIERGICILKNGNDNFYWRKGKSDGELGTHPPAERRKEALRKIFVDEHNKDDANLAIAGEQIMKKLWSRTKEELIKKYQSGIELHEKWI